MDRTKVTSPLKSPVRASASERAAQRLFGKSPGWKERFRTQCLSRINGLRYNAQIQHRQAQAASESSEQANLVDPHSNAFAGSLTPNSSVDQSRSEWMEHFIEQELGQFEYHDDDWDLDEQLTLEEQSMLFGDLNDAFHREMTEEEERLVNEHINQEEMGFDYQASLINDDFVSITCPICGEHTLEQDDVSISCHCGLRQDIFYSHMDLAALAHNMAQLHQVHSENCGETPFFFCKENDLASYLYMGCNGCGNEESVL
jgi:ribosomal protein S27E